MKTLSILFILGLLIPSFGPIAAQDTPPTGPPQDLNEIKRFGERLIPITITELPKTIKETWEKEVLPIWKNMWGWFDSNLWSPYFKPWVEKAWQVVQKTLGKEIETRKPIIKEEFAKEKKEMKEDAPNALKSVWEKLKEIVR